MEVLHQIGEGSYGDVLKGRWKQTPVALKRLRGDLSSDQMRAFGDGQVQMHPSYLVVLMEEEAAEKVEGAGVEAGVGVSFFYCWCSVPLYYRLGLAFERNC